MSEDNVVVNETGENTGTLETQEITEVPVPVVVEPEPEITYEYQPVDDFGRPLGAKQVFKGKNAQEVLDKVANAHKESIKLNRELKKNIRLGNIEQDEIPEEAPRFEDYDFTPKQLSAEEKYQLSQDLLDPEKFDEATDRLFEAKIGANPQKLTRALQSIPAIQVKNEAESFVKDNPDYYGCKENFETITNWMLKNNLAPIRDNFQLAYNRLKAVGLLLEAPIVREENPVIKPPEVEVKTEQPAEEIKTEEIPANSQPVAEPDSRITDGNAAQAKRAPRVASGLTNQTASNADVINQSKKLTVAEIEKMSSIEYKKRLADPAFRKAVDEAYAKKT